MTELDVAREHPELADWDAAYVLGALPPADRRRYELHLDACARCRAAVAELSGLPGLLAGVPADRVGTDPTGLADSDDLPADLLPRLAAAADRSRRRSRIRYGVAGGLVAAAAVVAAVLVIRPGSTPTDVAATPPAVTSTGTSAAGVQLALQPVVPNPLAVDVALVQEPWGTRLNLRCQFAAAATGASSPDRAYSYTLFATNRAGSTMQVGAWSYGPDSVAEPVGTSSWPVAQIATVEVRASDGTVLLRGTR